MGLFSRRPATPARTPTPGARVEYLVAPAFDVVGDLHGGAEALVRLLDALGYDVRADAVGVLTGATHPEGRRLVFLGDLSDRGAEVERVMESVRQLVAAGHECVLGNHDALALSLLSGQYQPTEYLTGFETTYDAVALMPPETRAQLRRFLQERPIQILAGRPGQGTELVLAHAGLPQGLVGRGTPEAVRHAVHGLYPPGVYDALKRGGAMSGWPEAWACAVTGPRLVMGHIARAEPLLVGRLVLVDTGSVYGGTLTAYRYPECTTLSVPGAPPAP